MKRFVTILLNILLLSLFSCSDKMLNYPYAENNTIIESYFSRTVKDDYRWLDVDKERSESKRKWLEEELALCDNFFKNRSRSIFNSIESLSKFENYSNVKSSGNSIYFCGVERFSKKINIYRFDKKNSENVLVKTVELPYYPKDKINALVLQQEKCIAIIGGAKGKDQNLYLFNLTDNSTDPVKVFDNVIDRPITITNNGFLFNVDNISSEKETQGISSLYHCYYDEENLSFPVDRIYMFDNLNTNKSFDLAFDLESNTVYCGFYQNDAPGNFIIESVNLSTKQVTKLKSIKQKSGEDLNLGGADNINLYIVGTDKKFRGTLYTVDKKSLLIDTILTNNIMPVKDFSLIKDHALIYFQGHKSNRAYLVNKKTKAIDEVPIKDDYFYGFMRNKKCDTIFFQKESLITPREVNQIAINDLSKTEKIITGSNLPYNPDDYEIEYVTVKSKSGNNVNLQLTYKKGMRRDGSNPLLLCSFINSEDSFLDKFHLTRVLYMEHGYIFVQRAKSDSKKEIHLDNRIKDIYSAIQYLIKNKYTAKDKIALFGKEYGATAIMQLLNKYDDIEAPAILIDGIYDLVKYNETGRLLYNNDRLFQANNEASFDKLLNQSPYHNVVSKKSYPPILLMATNENLFIPKSHTYKMTAKLQMRTRGYHPIVMLTPDRINQLDEYSEYAYSLFIEHAFCFLSKCIGIEVQ